MELHNGTLLATPHKIILKVFCWMGPHKSINDTTATGWYGMNMADIRRIEEETKAVLDKERATGEKRGHEEAKE